ncbi:MAG: DUF2271 domain-containing protein [Zoogloeaceae bacterium]|nr:DUF2271 domain-containing protein [Zoogloeaceae bacterium]
MHKPLLFTLGLLAAAPALAATIEVEVELPKFDVADYRRPYVAIWLERPDNSVAANLAVWYDAKMRNDEGSKWLKDMRQWWRRTGRTLELPIDGVTSATRHPGQHTLKLTAGQAPLGDLQPGEYRLLVEAAREHGGRELLSLPLQWPPTTDERSELRGEHELGNVSLQLRP